MKIFLTIFSYRNLELFSKSSSLLQYRKMQKMYRFILLYGGAFILVFNAGLLINCFQLRLIPPPHVHKDEVDLKDNDVLYILHDLCFCVI